MTSWAKANQEAQFKPLNGDFIFREGGWPSHHYVVAAAQKAEIQRLMKFRFSASVLLGAVAYIGGGVAAANLIPVLWMHVNGYDQVDPWIHFIVLVMMFMIYIFALRFSAHKRIAPALAGARYTTATITRWERDETLVRLLPVSTLLAPGVLFALCVALCAFAFFVQGLPMNPPERLLGWFGVIGSPLVAARFVYLTALKLILGHAGNKMNAMDRGDRRR